MANVVDASALTLNPEEAKSVGEVLFEKVFFDSPLSETHTIETGVNTQLQIVFGTRIGLLGKVSTGCTPSEAQGVTLTQKYWNPKLEDFRLKYCHAELPALLKLFNEQKRINPDFYNAVGSKDLGYIIAAVENGMLENIQRKVWFNDTAAATIVNGGVIKNGTDVGFFNSIDGLFKQIMTEIPTNAGNYVAIAANAGTTYAGQALADDAAYKIFEKMVNAADGRIMMAPDKFIIATRSLTDNYRNYLRGKNLGSGYMEVTQDGITTLKFDGIDIKVRYDWDEVIKNYYDNGTKKHLPHRAVLTTKSNIPIGTLNEEDLTTLDVFYDKTLKTNFMDGAYTLDAKHLEKYMTVAAY